MKASSRIIITWSISIILGFQIGLEAQNIVFDDSDPTVMTIDNGSVYTLGFNKSSGGLKFITSKGTGETICYGSRENKLWQVSFNYRHHRDLPESDFTENLNFYYSWSSSSNTLTFNYMPDEGASEKLSATAIITVSEESWFEMQLSVQNNYGDIIKSIWFPYHLEFEMNENSEALFPWSYPGVKLNGIVFEERQEIVDYYPGMYLADFTALKPQNSEIAIYTHRNGLPIRWTNIGITPYKNNNYEHLEENRFYFLRQYSVWEPNDSTWNSPVTRFRIDEPYFASLVACREENGLNEFPTIAEKLGDKIDILQRPMYTLYFGDVNPITFNEIADAISPYPGPSTILMNGHFKGGFDNGIYPDVDPDPKWGTEEEFKNMIGKMKEAGHIVMPFILFGALHEESTTYSNLMQKTTIDQIARIDTAGEIDKGYLNDELEYIISPSNPLLFQEWERIKNQLFNEYQADLVYQDVAGVAGPEYDFNPHMPSPVDSKEGWLKETLLFEDQIQLVEGGNDRLLETCEGFMGSNIISRHIDPDDWLITGRAEHFPATAALFQGQIMPFNFWYHQLENAQMLSWSLAYGVMLEINLEGDPPIGIDFEKKPWDIVACDFQREVMPRILSNPLTGFTNLDHNINEFIHDNISIIYNADLDNPFNYEDNILSPGGCLVRSESGDLIAGVFHKLNGIELTEGDHFIISKVLSDTLLVIQSKGPETELAFKLPNNWAAGNNYWAAAYDQDKNLIGSVPVFSGDAKLSFTYRESFESQHVTMYKIFAAEEKPIGKWEYFFNDFWGDTIKLGNRNYEIGLDYLFGNIKYVLNKANNDTLCLMNNPVWQAEFPQKTDGPTWVNSEGIDAETHYLDFGHSWKSESQELTWQYKTAVDTVPVVWGIMTLNITNPEYFDYQLSLENRYGALMEKVRFPYGLDLNTVDSDFVYLPYDYPGIRLSGSYFNGSQIFEANYPTDLIGDFIGVDANNSHFSIYTITKDQDVKPVTLFFDSPWFSQTKNTYNHDFWVYVEDGETWEGPVIRFRIGKDINKTLSSYRKENGIDAFPSVEDKLDAQYLGRLKAPLVYSTFGNYLFDYNQAASLSGKFPDPSLVLLDWYYPGNQPAYGYHPDIYPPKSDFGTNEEFTSMVKDMQEMGHFVAPWTLPVWWHQNAPTVLNLSGSQGLEDFVVIDMDGKPVEVSMGPKGYLPSPHHFAVKNKLNDLYQWHQQSFGFDNVYEHWKARHWVNYDLNSSEPNPTNYYQGWLQHQKNHSNANLMVQTGYDRQLEFANGFVGSLVRNPDEDSRFPHIDPSKWEIWPVSAPLARGKTLIYQDGYHQTTSKEILSFNLAFGCMLNMWPDSKNESNMDSQWWDVVEYFQQEVLSVIGDKQITGYQILGDNITLTSFDDHIVIRNLDKNTGYTHNNHTISGNGAMVDLFWGSITAGIFTGYNGQELSGGDHYLIEKKEEKLVTIWHPKGSNTNIRILKPWSWSEDGSLSVFAVTDDGEESISSTIDGRKVDFRINNMEGGKKVVRYEIRYGGELSGFEENKNSPYGISLAVYPNPATKETIISYTLDQPGKIKISLYDTNGKEINRIIDKYEISGSYMQKLEKLVIPNGIYYLVLETNSKRIFEKVIIGESFK